MNEKKTGIFLSYALVVVDAVCGIAFTTILLNKIGQTEYGIYKLALSWMSMVSVLDFGLGGTITRYIIKYKTESDKKNEENFLAMAFIVYGFLSFLVLIVGAVLGFALPLFSKSIPVEQISKFRIVFFLLVAKTSVVLFNHAFSGRFIAYEKFVYSKTVSLSYTILRLAFLAGFLAIIPSVITVVCIDLLLTVMRVLINMTASRHFGLTKAHFYKWENGVFKEVFLFTSSIFLASVINKFNSSVDGIVLGVFFSTIEVGLYASVVQIYTVYAMLSTAIQEVYLPQVSKTVFAKKSDDEITRAIVVPSRMQMFILFLALTGYLLFGYDFLRIWIGNSYENDLLEQAFLVGCILLTSATWQLFQNSATNILKAKNLLRGKVLITAASTVLNFIVTIMLVPRYGMLGAAIGTAISMILGYGVSTNIYYHIVVGINLKLYYKETFSKLWYTVPCAFAIGVMIKLIGGDGFWGFIIKAFIYTLVYLILVGFFGLNQQEKESLKIKLYRRRS